MDVEGEVEERGPLGEFAQFAVGVKTKISPDDGRESNRCASAWGVFSINSRRRPSHISLVSAPWLTPL